MYIKKIKPQKMKTNCGNLTEFKISFHIPLVFLLVITHGFIDLALAQRHASCSKHTCQAPDCRCPAHSIPGNLKVDTVPQMVLIAFDDAVNWDNWDFYLRLLPPDGSRKNPNGCPISATFFVSHNFTDYCMVGKLHARGMEIGDHSVTHRLPRKWWTDGNKTIMAEEVLNQRRNLVEKAGIPVEDIKGWRSPFLQPAGNDLFSVLYENNFTYDATMTYSFPKNLYSPVLWPFTLDFGYTLVCNIARCPQNFYKGLWEIPVVGVMDYREHKLCAYVDDCFNMPRDKNDAYKMLWKNFLRNYRSNRAPLYLNLHSPWLTTDYQLDAMDEFIQKMVSMEDVYLVTMSQALAWQKDPTPLDKLANFQPWQCPGFRPYAEDIKQCSFTFRHKHAPGRGHGTGIETTHGRRRAQMRQDLWRNRHSTVPKTSTLDQNRHDKADKTDTTNEVKAHKVDAQSTSHAHREKGGEGQHLYHHHDHRTHKPWFLRGSASAVAPLYSGMAILFMTVFGIPRVLTP